MSKHTPGPWATLGALGLEVRPEFPARGSTVGFAPLAKVVGDTRLMDEAEREANARLISASPRMYSYIESRADAGDEEAKKIIAEVSGA